MTRRPLVVALAALGLCPAPLAAWEVAGRYAAADLPVPYVVDPDRLPYGVEAVRAAAEPWSTHPRIAFAFQFAGTGPGAVRHGQPNTVRMDRGQMGQGVLGLTYRWSTAGGRVTGFDMELNGRWQWTRAQFLNTTLHEFGHALGLGHSRDPGAVMKPSADGSIVTLQPDDVEGAAFLYPALGAARPPLDPPGPPADAPGPTRALAPVGRIGPEQAAFRWAPAAGAERYEVALDTLDAQGRQTKLLRLRDLSVTEVELSGPLAPGRYRWFARGVGAGGAGPWATADFEVPAPGPGVPALLAPEGPSRDGRPTLAWTAVPGATAYDVLIETEAGEVVLWAPDFAGTALTPSWALAPAVTHRVRVRAHGPAGAGAWSAPALLRIEPAAAGAGFVDALRLE